MKRVALLGVGFVAFAIFVGRAAAQGEAPPTPSPDEVNAIARNLYCPVCANVPLDACGTAACAQWRQQIVDLLLQGYSEQQIYDYFAEQYGPGVLASPPAQGFNWAVYILPPLAILVAGYFLWTGLNKSKRNPPKVNTSNTGDKFRDRLEKDLKARK